MQLIIAVDLAVDGVGHKLENLTNRDFNCIVHVLIGEHFVEQRRDSHEFIGQLLLRELSRNCGTITS